MSPLANSTQQLVCCKVTSTPSLVVVGHLRLRSQLSLLHADILLDPSFEEVQRSFCERHCHKFEVRPAEV